MILAENAFVPYQMIDETHAIPVAYKFNLNFCKRHKLLIRGTSEIPRHCQVWVWRLDWRSVGLWRTHSQTC